MLITEFPGRVMTLVDARTTVKAETPSAPFGLSRSEFESEVKRAIKVVDRPDLLVDALWHKETLG